MPDDGPYARHVAAIVVAEWAGSEGAHDERPDIRAARALARLRASGGDAETIGAGVVLAVFDAAPAAARATMALHRESREPPARWRAGLHVADVILTPEDTVASAAVARARALARAARPGTTAVAAEAIAALGRGRKPFTVERLVGPKPPDESDGSLCLLVPRWDGGSRHRRRLAIVLVSAAAIGWMGGVLWWLPRKPSGTRRGGLAIGVGPFLASGLSADDAWMGPALRDGLNTQLSDLRGIQVYSSEFIDFLIDREGLTTIEVANRLGIQKMLSGNVFMAGDTVRVETRVVDVASGVLDGAHVTSGLASDFLGLETAVVLGAIATLGLQLSPEDERRVAAQRATDVETLRLLLDASGVLREPAPRPEPIEPGPGSLLHDLLGPRVARADETAATIEAFLEDYRRATEARDVVALTVLYAEFPPEQRTAIGRYFSTVGDLRVRIEHVEAAVVGDEAVVSYTRTDDFVDIPTGRRIHVSIRPTKVLRRIDGAWRFAPVR